MKNRLSLIIILTLCSLLFTQMLTAQTVSITASDWATAQSLKSGASVTDYSKDGVTVSFAQATGNAVTYNGSAIAAGEGNTLTITAATGYQLTAMSFTQNVAAQATRLAANAWSSGSASVNAQNNKQVDWTGAAGQVSVSFTGNQVFTAFSVTYEDMNKSFTVNFVGADGIVLKTESVLYGNAATPPTPPAIAGKVFKDWDKDYTNITEDMTITAVYDFDPAVMNDTVEMWAKDIMDYNELTAGEKFENIDYQKDGKTIIVDKGTATSNYNYPYYYYDSWNYAYGLVVQSGNKITFKAPFKIHKILIHHYIKNYYDGYPDCADCNPPTTNTGTLSFENVYITWEGSSSLVEINFTEYTQILDFTIIGDKNDDKSTVRFFDFDGKLLDTKNVKDGSNVTAPAYNHACFAGWDKSLSGIYEDLDVHPVREKLLDLTATAWRDSETGSKRITMGDFTLIPTNRWNDEEAEFGETNMGNWVYIPHLVLCTNKPLTIVGKDWFQNLTMICPEGYADKLAAATFSSGTAKQEGNNVLWSGDTDSLVITPTQDCNIFEFVIYCQEHETPSFTVVFLDENDNELKRETVARGNSVTPPAYSAPDDCHIFKGWDKDLSRVRGDMTVRPVLETKVIQSLSAIGWARLQNDSSSNAAMQNVETNGYAFSAPNSRLQSREQRINREWVTIYYITVYRGGTISIASDNYVRNITFTVLNEHDAENLAAATYSQGTATRDSIRVTWQGATDKLDITLPTDDNIGLTLIEINCEIITDHTVTFLDRDGKVIDTKVVADGNSVTPPAEPAPENECYEFKGWSEKLSNIRTDLTVKPVFEFIKDCIPAGFVRVTFVDFAGDTLTSSFVEIGGTAVAPEAPGLKYHKFIGWSHPLSNITETVTIKPTYSFDLDSKDILTVQQAYDLITKDYSEYDKGKDSPYEYYHDWNDFALKDMYAVRGIVCVYPNNGNRVTLSDGKLSFNVADVMIENGETNGNTLISGYSMLGENIEPFISNLQLQNGDTVIMYGQLGRFHENVGYGNYYDYLGIGNGYIPYIGKWTSDEGIVYLDMPDAAAMYDFSGNSLKQLLQHNSKCNYDYSTSKNICSETLAQTGDYTTDFAFDKTVYSANEGGIGGDIKFITGISDDKYAVSLVSGSNAKTLFSDNTSIDGTVVLPNMDFNGDGRLDYFVVNKLNFINTAPVFGGVSISEGHAPRRPNRAPSKAAATPQYEHYVAYTQPDGSLKLEYIYAMSWDEYQAQMSDTEWATTAKELTYSSGRGLITPNYGYGAGMAGLSAVSLSRAPRRAPSIGYTVPFITKALDLNADNLTDLIDEKNGILYLNMGNGQFVLAETNGMVVPADLNNDGLMDFIFPGEKLYTSIYKGEGKFETKTIYENAAVDDLLYCYDFDHDDDIDILATFSAQANATKTAYTCFFLNDGNGNFTQQSEQNYGTDNLWFSALQDIDGDGYFDLLAFRADINSNYEINHTYVDENGYTQFYKTQAEIVWLRGSQNNLFASPSVLYNLTYNDYQDSGWGAPAMNVSQCRINAEDLDGDGKAEIWVSGLSQGKTHIFTTEFGDKKTFSVTANTAPVAPAAPELRYDNGILTVTWGNGSDKETMVGDLTYALRLGTKPGSNDILCAAANADGSRRNFLDGNMGNRHTYTIDLSTYAPSKIYASVQTIDAQHKGSAWSEEASIDHTALPAQFTMSSDRIAFNETVKIHYTQLPKDYSHTWLYADGELLRDGSFIHLTFPTAGEKVITHTVTAPDGKAASFTATLTVLPAGMSSDTLTFGDDYETNKSLFTEAVKADFNNDGLLDAYYNKYISQATSLTTYTQATGLWNTNIQGTNNSALWLDWNKNGYADMLTASGETGYYLPHADNQPDMTAQKQDDNISLYFANNVYRLGADLLHDGYPTAYSQGYLIQQHAGSEYGYTEVSLKNGDTNLLKNALEGAANNYYTGLVNNFIIDYDRDGYFDIAYLRDEYIDNVNQYRKLLIFLNRGNAEFEQTEIPFTQSIASGDFRYPQLADLNNDGYIDILATRDFWTESSDGSIYILWNNQNQNFSAPDILPLGNLQSFNVNGYNGNQLLIDINNDGYLDIISLQKNSAAGNDINGIYVWYMGPQGVLTQGFLIPQTNLYNLYSFSINTMIPNELLVNSYKKDYDEYGWETETPVECAVVSINANNAPAAPQGVRAVQTSDGLLIEWNPADDDHTPATQMRYNLSVKHAGRSGAGSFVISPQNGLNSKTAYLPAHKYLSATRFLVPLSELTAGDYEVQVQAIDQRNLMSDFSDVVTVNIDRQIIDAPTTVCTYDEVTVTYMSEDRTGTPVWDFDGGAIVSGSGFGPYRISWEDEGTKTITLTIGDKTYTRMLYADQVSGWADLPAALFDGGSVDVSWSDNLYGELEISINGTVQSVTTKGIDGRDPQLTFDNHTLKLDTRRAWSKENALTNFSSLELILTLTNANGCAGELRKSVEIISADNSPQITLVTSDADGHNIISWNADADLFPQIQILKETNIRDQFVELGVVSTKDGRYTDLSSDATQRAERYAIRGIMNGGTRTPASPVHQTVHTTINRGATDNQWNLIWNQYVGADVVTYNILRGSAEGTLTQIASVSSYNTSFTDYAPQDAQPYYAIEYVLAEQTSPTQAPAKAPQASSLQGRSNIVNRSAAKTMTYAQSLTILSANGKYETTADNRMLLLYAEVMPSNTTYKQVVWEITEGATLATIDQSTGLLTARTPNNGGTITVRATAVDGSGVTATRQIKIAAIAPQTPAGPTYFTVTFYDWNGIVIKTEQVEEGTSATAPNDPQREGYIFIGWDTDYSNVHSDLVVTAKYEKITGIDDVEQDQDTTKQTPRKVIENGRLYIILPDGTHYDALGRKVKVETSER